MGENLKYQKNLSMSSPILLDERHKDPKVQKMLAVLGDAGLLSSGRGVAVDVGCSAGFFVKAVEPYFSVTVGVDIDLNALLVAKENNAMNDVKLFVADSMQLPFKDASIDLIVCNHVYEHVPSSSVLFSEIMRVLSPQGVCYLGAASRLTIIEPHYHLMFLSWLPKKMANYYMRLMGKGDVYYECLRTRWGLNELLNDFAVEDYTLRVIDDPDKFCAREMIKKGGVIDRLPSWFIKMIYWFLPSYIFLLKKPLKERV